MRYNQARDLAIHIGNKLVPFCERLNIAGSIRRQKAEVKDIEIVCIPRSMDLIQSDLFGAKTVEKVISENYVGVVKSLGRIVKGKPDGRYMQIELPQRVNLDLFMPHPDDYFRQYAIRTGSADYVRRNITVAWLKKGWCGSDKGLRKQTDCTHEATPDGKGKWICHNPFGEWPPVWASEQEFFDWLGIPMIAPKMRIT